MTRSNHILRLRARLNIEKKDPFGITNEPLGVIATAKFTRGNHFHHRWVPLRVAAVRPPCIHRGIRQIDRLRGWPMRCLYRIAHETPRR